MDYAISFRQRQLASLTPTEVIRLSLLSAMLEKPTPKFQSTSRQSKCFSIICQFLEDATRIVPVESISHAIESESEDNAWKCAEALIESKFEPLPSLLFMTSLINAHLRLTTGVKPAVLQRVRAQAIREVWDPFSPIRTNIQVSNDKVVVTAEKGRATQPVISKSKRGHLHYKQRVIFDDPEQPLFSDVVRNDAGKRHISISLSIPKLPSEQITLNSKHHRIITRLKKMSDHVTQQFSSNKQHSKSICGLNIDELYPVKGPKNVPASLKPPIEFLKDAKKKLLILQQKAQEEILSLQLADEDEDAKNFGIHHNEEMIGILNEVMSEDIAICLSLLGAFMERQMRVPFVNSASETAQVLQTTQTSSAVGVWTLFSLNMLNMESLLKSHHGKLIIEVEKYIEGILNRRERAHSPDRGRYAGKLQFLMVGMGETVSCNTQYISYSLERQLATLCKSFDIKPSTRVNDVVRKWDKTFSNSILFHVMVGFRPLLARWLIWSLNIHKLREELALHTTVGIVGLSKSGKSCLVKGLFRQDVSKDVFFNFFKVIIVSYYIRPFLGLLQYSVPLFHFCIILRVWWTALVLLIFLVLMIRIKLLLEFQTYFYDSLK